MQEHVADQMVRYRAVTNSSRERRDDALREHRDICAAITSGDEQRAATVAFEHVLAARDEALRAVEDNLGVGLP